MARELLAEFELDAPVRLLGIGVGGLVAVAEERSERRRPADVGQEPLALRNALARSTSS